MQEKMVNLYFQTGIDMHFESAIIPFGIKEDR